jgi:arginyl-tRNA synthetase
VTDQPENVLDEVLEVLQGHGLSASTRLSVPHHPGRRDLSLFGLDRDRHSGVEEVVDEIRSLTAIGKVSIGRGERIGIRFSDRRVGEIGELLEAGETDVLSTRGICPDKRLVVDFCDPNASKALHVGHLRNLALGQSVARIVRACGATVITTSQIGDVGRSMAEAIAGYMLYADGESPAGRDEKSDHFIGRCYSRYVQEEAGAAKCRDDGHAGDPALSREDLEYADLAATVLRRLRQADPEIAALWRKVRDWSLGGHQETLDRLGVTFDRQFLESEFLAEIESVGDRLVEKKMAEVAPNGVVFYRTGDSNYPHLVLRRSDGNSTQHLRYIALWHATQAVTPGDSLQVMGDEWLHIGRYGEILLKSLSPDGVAHPMDQLLHGMVSVDDTVVKSSGADPWLIDELLDELVSSPEIERRAGGDDRLADRLAVATALGFFLGFPPAKKVALVREDLFDPAANGGWAMALASLKAWEEQYDGPPDPQPADRAYRFLIAQSQVHQQLARRACEELNPVHLARLHIHLARWFLESPCAPSLARAMRTMSSVGLSTLGLGSMRLTGLEPVSAA